MNGIIIQQEVVYKTDRGTPVTDSLKVAEVFGKRHDNVLKSIRNICRPQNVGEQTEQSKWFYESSYIDANGAKRPMFVMNRDGFSLLAMGLTGAKGNAIQGRIHRTVQRDGNGGSPSNANHPGNPTNLCRSIAPCSFTS